MEFSVQLLNFSATLEGSLPAPVFSEKCHSGDLSLFFFRLSALNISSKCLPVVVAA